MLPQLFLEQIEELGRCNFAELTENQPKELIHERENRIIIKKINTRTSTL